jgi:hypothetical protein
MNTQLAGSATACTAASPCAGYAQDTVQWNFAANGQNSFGQITGDRGPREIQYALKISF